MFNLARWSSHMGPLFRTTFSDFDAILLQPFYFGLFLCKVSSIQQLADKIQVGKKIPKSSVIQESTYPVCPATITHNNADISPVTKKFADPDIVTTSQVLSLKCPLSFMRMEVPCRSHLCTHIQCFDATSYLQLQEQGPQWLCPICNKSAPYETLAVDE
jgi:E3 SUMO-protein ligase PIAS1